MVVDIEDQVMPDMLVLASCVLPDLFASCIRWHLHTAFWEGSSANFVLCRRKILHLSLLPAAVSEEDVHSATTMAANNTASFKVTVTGLYSVCSFLTIARHPPRDVFRSHSRHRVMI